MKEQINLSLTDLDNQELTLKQLILVVEKISVYYADKDLDKYKYFVENGMVFFYMLYQIIQDSKGEEDEN